MGKHGKKCEWSRREEEEENDRFTEANQWWRVCIQTSTERSKAKQRQMRREIKKKEIMLDSVKFVAAMAYTLTHSSSTINSSALKNFLFCALTYMPNIHADWQWMSKRSTWNIESIQARCAHFIFGLLQFDRLNLIHDCCVLVVAVVVAWLLLLQHSVCSSKLIFFRKRRFTVNEARKQKEEEKNSHTDIILLLSFITVPSTVSVCNFNETVRNEKQHERGKEKRREEMK